MILTGILLFVLCLFLSAFFASSETAFIAANPYSLEYRERQGSRGAALARRIKGRTNDLLATILLGNTLVNAAAASLATSVITGLLPAGRGNQAVLYATAATTLLLLIFGEINPKTFAAHNSARLAALYAYPLRVIMVILAPLVKLFNMVSWLIMPSSRAAGNAPPHRLNEEETRLALRAGARNLSSLRRRIVSGALDMGSRPVKEIMVPRPEIKAIDIDAGREAVLAAIRTTGYSRYPVFRGRLDNIEGVVHSKDIAGYLIDNIAFAVKDVMRKPMFVPDLATLEQVLLQMQEKAVHMALVVDEYGNVDGLVTLEDIIEEIVGDIQDEHDGQAEAWYSRLDGGRLLVNGAAPIKDVNALAPLGIPEKPEYTTLAGFFLDEFGRLPREKDSLVFGAYRLTVERMAKRRIALVEIAPAAAPAGQVQP
ncbi:MAG TPA: hemolysin family protein [Candidatus Aminicenantes bacterium]|nr:hemolysin family protein [Candidatus Aminicenantes bacterium]HRY64200.1 hemolysin family protein [Candidatus Aminicenantes bacterium]HRZ71113.1 hemolysin family protein [Candidatus Aminicenantes bacterium]